MSLSLEAWKNQELADARAILVRVLIALVHRDKTDDLVAVRDATLLLHLVENKVVPVGLLLNEICT